MKTRKIGLACLALAAALLPSLAFAGGPSFFEPVEGDLAIKLLLQPIFGELFGQAGSAPGQMSGALGVLNMAALTVGGLIAAYVMVLGVVSTARSGQMLAGKSTAMATLRTVFGLGALVPLGSGLCVAQFILAWGVGQGVGLADKTWSTFAVSALSDTGTPAMVRPQSVEALSAGVMKSLVCLEGLRWLNSSGAATSTDAVVGQPQTTGSFEAGQKKLYGTAESPSLCGGVNGPVVSQGAVAKFKDFFGAGEANTAPIVAAHVAATTQLEAALLPIAQRIVKGEALSSDAATYRGAMRAYGDAVATAAKTQLGGADYFSKLKEASSRDGFALAGAWHLRLATTQNEVNSAFAAGGRPIPTEKAPNPSIDASLQNFYEGIAGAIGTSSLNIPSGISNAYRIETEAKSGDKSWLGAKIDGFFDDISAGIMEGMKGNLEGSNPLAVANAYGQGMLLAGSGGFIAGGILDVLGASGTAALVGAVAMALLGLGATLTFVLPLLPFMIWFGLLIGWICSLVIAISGVPLWALSFVFPSDSDNFSGHGSGGFKLFLGAILTPALMIVGLGFAITAQVPILNFWNQTFFSVASVSSSGGILGVASAIAACIIYVLVMLSTTRFIFGLAAQVPERALSWGSIAAASITSAGSIATEAAAGGAAASVAAAAGAGAVSKAGGRSAGRKIQSLRNRWNGSASGASGAEERFSSEQAEGQAAGASEAGETVGSSRSIRENPVMTAGAGGMGQKNAAADAQGEDGGGASSSEPSTSSASSGSKDKEPSEMAHALGAGVKEVSASVAGHMTNAAVGGGVQSPKMHSPERSISKASTASKSKPADRAAAGKAEAGAAAGSATQAQAVEAEAAEAEAEAAEAEARAQAASMPEMNGKA